MNWFTHNILRSLLIGYFCFYIEIGFSQTTVNDTTPSADTDTVKKKIIPPDTRRIFVVDILNQNYKHKPVGVYLDNFHYWDDLDTLSGVSHHLGQVGKPYQHFRFGVNDKWFTSPYWRNPLTQATNLYILNPEYQTMYYDTKTPYVNINFAQGPQQANKNITLLEVTTSYNVTPFFNLAAFYKRRQSESIYGNNTADNRLIHLNGYYHSFKNRLAVFSTLQYNEFYQLYNGGTARVYGSPEESSFDKGSEYLNLSDATGKWIVKSATIEPIFHLIFTKDSTRSGQKLSLKGLVQHEYTRFRFGAENIRAEVLNAAWVPPLPTFSFEPDKDAMYEKTETYRYRAGSKVLYGFNLKDYLRLEAKGGLEYNRLVVTQKDSAYRLTQNTFVQTAEATLSSPRLLGFEYNLSFYTRPNNLFNPETYWGNTARFRIPFTINKDSLQREDGVKEVIKRKSALHLTVFYLLHSMNPSIFQKYLPPGYGNRFSPDSTLKNQQLNHLRASLKWEGSAKINQVGKARDTLLSNYFSVQPFLSQCYNMIYYSDTLQVRQAKSGDILTFSGMEMSGRIRFFRKIYTEANVGILLGTVNAEADSFLWVYSQSQPNLYGKISIFYQNERTAYKGVFRTGIDFRYNAPYYGNGFDPVSAEFFPVNPNYPYIVKGYPRIDIYFATRIKRAYIFAKIIHVTDGLIAPGNYTTPFYPVQPRMFSLGVNWSFFD